MKRSFITLVLLLNTAMLYAQQYTAKDLVGRWASSRNKNTHMIFTSDSTGAWLDKGGLMWNRFKYTTTTQKPGARHMEFRFTVQLDRERPGYDNGYIKFLNDSTFLIRIHSWDIPKDADTSNKKVSVFVKIKHPVAGQNHVYPLTAT